MGFSVKEIKDLMDKMQQTGLGELEVEDEGYTLKLSAKKAKKTVENVMMAPAAPVVSAAPIAAAPVAAAPAAPAAASSGDDSEEAKKEESSKEEEGTVVTAPTVGTYYAAAGPDKPPFVKPGQDVSKGDVLYIIEAMKVMNEIKSEMDGTIGKIFVKNGDPVEFGQPILTIV